MPEPKIRRHELAKWQGLSKKVTPFRLPEGLEPLSRAKPSDTSDTDALGHLLTSDGRLALRIVLDSEASAKFGAKGLTPVEGTHLLLRIASLQAVEAAAVELQRECDFLYKALVGLYGPASRGEMPAPAAIVDAARVLREII